MDAGNPHARRTPHERRAQSRETWKAAVSAIDSRPAAAPAIGGADATGGTLNAGPSLESRSPRRSAVRWSFWEAGCAMDRARMLGQWQGRANEEKPMAARHDALVVGPGEGTRFSGRAGGYTLVTKATDDDTGGR